MTSVHETTDCSSADDRPTVFRYDYPEAVAGEWAVFWEVTDEELFCTERGNVEDPTRVADEAWIAMTDEAVVSLDEMR